MDGILNVYKEAGFTSHDVVAKLRGICRQRKIGHTGTLDPDAVGVLPVCLGSATKLCDMLTDKSKEYEAVLRLGVVTDTQDLSGRVLEEHPVESTEEEAVAAVLSFLGEYDQIPPMYSALKVDGKKLYELARAGKEVERKARRVCIDRLEILDIALPDITIRVGCSKGTYIRTLCHDIGSKLGCGGAMASLKRTRVGMFRAEDALTLAQIQTLADEGRVGEALIPVEDMFSSCPKLVMKPGLEKLTENGNPFLPEHAVLQAEGACGGKEPDADMCGDRKTPDEGVQVRVYSAGGRFYGIYAYRARTGRYHPVKMFLT